MMDRLYASYAKVGLVAGYAITIARLHCRSTWQVMRFEPLKMAREKYGDGLGGN